MTATSTNDQTAKARLEAMAQQTAAVGQGTIAGGFHDAHERERRQIMLECVKAVAAMNDTGKSVHTVSMDAKVLFDAVIATGKDTG